MAEERCFFPASPHSLFTIKDVPKWSRTRYGKVAAATAIDVGARDIWQIESGHEYYPKALSTSGTRKEKTGTRRKERENVVKFLEYTATDIEKSSKEEVILEKSELPTEIIHETAKRLGLQEKNLISKDNIKRRESENAASEGESAEEDSSEEELSDADSSDIFTIGGKTSYAAFMDRLDDLEDVDIDEMTTRISAGLKTWLNFGVTVAGNPKQQATFEPTPHAETHSQLKKMWSEQSAKLAMDTVPTFGSKKGSKPKKSKGIASQKIAAMTKGSDKLAKAAEEQSAKISGEFCGWLRELPKGDDDTVNNTSPETIQALFDDNPSNSGVGRKRKPLSMAGLGKLAMGIGSWLKFGKQTMSIAAGERDPKLSTGSLGGDHPAISNFANTQLSKIRFRKRVRSHKEKRERQRLRSEREEEKKKARASISETKLVSKGSPRKYRLDHRYYGDAWFIEPLQWEKRYHNMHSKKALKETIQKRKTAQEKFSTSEGAKSTSEKTSKVEEDQALSQLYSTKAFATFLSRRENYEPPSFLKNVLNMEELKQNNQKLNRTVSFRSRKQSNKR